MEDKSSWVTARPLSSRSTSHDIGTVEPVDLDLTGFLRDEIRETSAAQRDEANMRAMGRRQLLDRNFGGQSLRLGAQVVS
jgi:hypothetical protein